jgi:uncharacterized protein YqjF (DUF2071 family)
MNAKASSKLVGGGEAGVFELEPPTGPCVMRQRWRDLLFLHWRWSAEAIQATLPAGLTVDTFEGSAYVGVVPFQMEAVRPRFLPAVPGVSWFGELNLRTYVVGPNGRPGVWFYSLDAHQHLAVWIARRLFSLPYHYAKITQHDTPTPGSGPASGRNQGGPSYPINNRRIAYHWQRESASAKVEQPAFIYDTPDASLAKPTEPGTLAHWLVERYLLFSRRPMVDVDWANRQTPVSPRTKSAGVGKLYVGRVEHEPYRVASVEVERDDRSLFALNGFDPPEAPAVSALWSPGVEVMIYPLHRYE